MNLSPNPFSEYPDNWQVRAFQLAVEAKQKQPHLDLITEAFYCCQRWQACPWLPDCPPVNGVMTPSPCEHPAHPMPELEGRPQRPFVRIGEIIDKIVPVRK